MGDAFVAVDQEMLAGPKGHRRLGEDILVVAFLQPGIEGRGHGSAYIYGRRFLTGLAFWPLILHDLHDTVAIWHPLIDGKLVGSPDADDEGYRHAGGEAEDVDKGVAAVLAELADGEEEIVFEHAVSFRTAES